MRIDFLQKNSELLKTHHPALWQQIESYLNEPFPGRIIKCRDQRLSLAARKEDGTWISIHPQDFPLANCEEFVRKVGDKEGQIIVFLGFGLGYEVMAACEKYSWLNLIHILEPAPILFAQAVKFIDLSPILTDKRIRIHLYGSEESLIGIASHLDRWYLLHTPPTLIPHPQLRELFTKAYHHITERLRRLVTMQYLQTSTTLSQGKTMFRNAFQNMPNMISGLPLASLQNRFKGRPAVIVAAGPSLAKNIEQLREVGDRGVIIAVDTAAPKLLARGIRPHFIVAMDYRHRNADAMWEMWEQTAGVSLIFLSLSTPYFPKLMRGQGQFYIFDKAPNSLWFSKMLGNPPGIDAITSVAHLALHSALVMGCDPVTFIGLDLAFAAHEVTEERIGKEDLLPVPGTASERVYVNPDFMVMLDKFEQFFSEGSAQFIDATEGGARKKHTTAMPFNETLQRYFPQTDQPLTLPVNEERDALVAGALLLLADTKAVYSDLADQCRTINKKAKWAYERLHALASSNHKQIEIDAELADTINTVREMHHTIIGDVSGKMDHPSHLLDTILATARLESHRLVLSWKKEHMTPNTTGLVSELLLELYNHSNQTAGMLEGIAWFMRRCGILSERFLLMQAGDNIEEVDDGGLLLQMGLTYLDCLDLPEAERCLAKALSLPSRPARLYLALGRLRLWQRESEKAMDFFREAESLDASLHDEITDILSVVAQEHLEAAQDRIQRGRPGAERYLRDILPGFPGYEEAQALLASITGQQ